MSFLPASHDPQGVAVSVAIAAFAAFVALDMVRRIRTHDREVALTWWTCGSLALGTGIWAMHFVGMLSFSLPIDLGYDRTITFLSWLAGIATAGAMLGVAGRGSPRWPRILAGTVPIALGLLAMHGLGMHAMRMLPAIQWNPGWSIAAVAIAFVGVAAALFVLFHANWLVMRRGATLGAAAVLGSVFALFHYTSMAASEFPLGSVCAAAGSLAGDSLAALVTMAAGGLLLLTLITSILDARMKSRTAVLAQSLRTANEELTHVNETLKRQAFVDALTGLPNRLLFDDRLRHAVRRCARDEERISQRNPRRLAVLFVDLDGFKPVNDSFGHAAGDSVLQQAAERLRAAARDVDTVARVGGDEFVLLVEDVSNATDCIALARRLVDALAEPFDIPGRRVEIAGSVGIVIYPDQGHPDKLMAHADAAMYAAKRAGGSTYALFESHMDDAGALEQLSLQNDLRHAADRGQLQLVYQPKVDSKLGQIRGVEALLRWNHPDRGVVSPGVFIPIAERFGMIGGIGRWVIDEACRQIAAWADDGVRMRVAINLSVHQLREADLVERIGAALGRHGIDPSQLLCEITESVAMEDIKATQRAFDGLAKIGVFLSIDDFGTGYSSLSYLRQLPARQLKIDRSFVADLAGSSDARAVVDAVVRLAHALGLKVVAEGVETQAQRDILLGLGCDELQGFFFARPMPAETLLAWTTGRQKPEGAVDFSPSVLFETESGDGATD